MRDGGHFYISDVFTEGVEQPEVWLNHGRNISVPLRTCYELEIQMKSVQRRADNSNNSRTGLFKAFSAQTWRRIASCSWMFLFVQKRRTSGVCGHLRNRKIFGISDIRNEPLWLLHRVTWLCLTAGCKIIELLRGPLAETLSANSLSGCVLNLWQGRSPTWCSICFILLSGASCRCKARPRFI